MLMEQKKRINCLFLLIFFYVELIIVFEYNPYLNFKTRCLVSTHNDNDVDAKTYVEFLSLILPLSNNLNIYQNIIQNQ